MEAGVLKTRKKNWTLKTKIKPGRTNIQVKKIACPRIQSLDHHAHFLDALPSHQVLTVIRGNQFNLYVSSRPQNHQKIEAEGGSNHASETLSESRVPLSESRVPLGW